MFCYQCEETVKNSGCVFKGVCGKTEPVSQMQDLLIYNLKGLAVARAGYPLTDEARTYIVKALFTTVTNVNFDDQKLADMVSNGIQIKKGYLDQRSDLSKLPDCATWTGKANDEFAAKAVLIGLSPSLTDDIQSLQELLIYGLKGIAAYYDHAMLLGYTDDTVPEFLSTALAASIESSDADSLLGYIMKAGEVAVTTMALLDKANTDHYGHPEITKVQLGVRENPAILISGHDLKDLEELLIQTAGTGVDVYTHGEMLPAHYYPKFKEFDHFVGNYGNAWWKQDQEFESFNGPVVMTTNCLIPPRESYRDRVYTTGNVAYPGLKHIADRPENGTKDFSPVIDQAQTCAAPDELESGSLVGGFAHQQVLALADKVIEAVNSGAVRKFVVMAGCDGRHKSRGYYTEFAEKLPEDTIILTAGCAKYRYNKLDLGDIGGIPRILDAGQCNDSYSLAVIALKLKEVFELEDINDLPITYNIAWYEQKAVTVLLALLFLGVKNIHLGPNLPAFLSPNVTKILVEKFGIDGIGTVEQDLQAMVA